jgi:hypothetical protein
MQHLGLSRNTPVAFVINIPAMTCSVLHRHCAVAA